MYNYFSKIMLAFRFSSTLKTFFKLIINSKKYSYNYKRNSLHGKADKLDTYLFKVHNKTFTLFMRTYTGDINIFYEIFWKNVYFIPFEFRTNIKNIVDLGAHIGLTSIYYSLIYPNAKIYSVEASIGNFQLLKQNLENSENVELIHSAIYSFDGEVKFDNSGLTYNHKISASGDSIPSISIKTLMNKYNIDKIDLLKIDIEGSEQFLLSQNNEWLAKVENIIIEIHPPYDISYLIEDIKPYVFTVYEPNIKGLKNIFATRQLC